MKTIVFMLLIGIVIALGFYFINQSPGDARVRMFAWPAVEVLVDGGKWTFEAPCDHPVILPAGRHTFLIEERNGHDSMAVSVRLKKGKTHSYRVDLDKGTFITEEAK